MKIKCNPPEYLAEIIRRDLATYEQLLEDAKQRVNDCEERISKHKLFWATNEKPVYDFMADATRQINYVTAREVPTYLQKIHAISVSNKREVSLQCCAHCGEPAHVHFMQLPDSGHIEKEIRICDCEP